MAWERPGRPGRLGPPIAGVEVKLEIDSLVVEISIAAFWRAKIHGTDL
jgi:hypothetical protein